MGLCFTFSLAISLLSTNMMCRLMTILGWWSCVPLIYVAVSSLLFSCEMAMSCLHLSVMTMGLFSLAMSLLSTNMMCRLMKILGWWSCVPLIKVAVSSLLFSCEMAMSCLHLRVMTMGLFSLAMSLLSTNMMC